MPDVVELRQIREALHQVHAVEDRRDPLLADAPHRGHHALLDDRNLLLESPDLVRDTKTERPATIVDLNEDSYPDLMVEFEANKSPLSGNFSHAILKGRLSDGTIIKGISVMEFRF